MTAEIYIEGGGPPDKLTNIRCREGFSKLLESCGLDGATFSAVACGGRGDAWNDFQAGHEEAAGEYYVGLLIDSEHPVANINETWNHLEKYDHWDRPLDAQNEQVLFMTTCMETWIVADRMALREHFGHNLQISRLPELDGLEECRRGYLNDSLESATLKCPRRYVKGSNSFDVLGKLDPDVLEKRLPSFHRARLILTKKLG